MMQAANNKKIITQAGEYVLGTLARSELVRFKQSLGKDVELQQEVQRWNHLLSPMLDIINPVTPPQDMWKRIKRALEPRVEKSVLWESISFWRNFGLVAATIVLGLGLTIFGMRPEPGMQRVMMIASQEDSKVEWIVGGHLQRNSLIIRAVNPPQLQQGQVCHLWMETSDGKLMLVGVLPHTGSIQVDTPAKLYASSRFKVSVESKQNSLNSKPSGRIIYTGKLTRI